MQQIKIFPDQSQLVYDNGKFDKWCVYYITPNGERKPPKDEEYFSQLKEIAQIFEPGKIYDDFVKIYDGTGKTVEERMLNTIGDISNSYGKYALLIQKIFTILYVAMISEENKAFTKLGKRIKRLGIHLLLKENAEADYAANCMRGLKWQQIDKECNERKF